MTAEGDTAEEPNAEHAADGEQFRERVEQIEALPLDARAEALIEVHDELLARLGAADAPEQDG